MGTALAALFLPVCLWPASSWKLVRSNHFELYTQGTDQQARAAIVWFEQLRTFFLEHTWLKAESPSQVRVISFGSLKEYEQYRLPSLPDAYFVGTDSRDYIVLPPQANGVTNLAAHEYTHLALHAAGLHLAPWLEEGLAELYSTVSISESSTEYGGELAARVQLLRRSTWIPLDALLIAQPGRNHDQVNAFYSQSWAMADMLMFSSEYGARFQQLIAALRSGTPDSEALTTVYARRLEDIDQDLRAWVNKRRFHPIQLPAIMPANVTVALSTVSQPAAESLLAELLLSAGELERAEAMYRDLARESPAAADVAAALGTIALRKGNREGALKDWRQAIRQGVKDPMLCYRYAVEADLAGLPPEEIRTALERALELKPDFDEARFRLGLLEKNTDHYQAAVTQLRAMRAVPSGHAYNYWIVLAGALNELGSRDEAIAAAKQAADHAGSDTERRYAQEVAYMARTDLTVQFTTDASGRTQMVTTRKPHDATQWNPFIEPGDDQRNVQGILHEIDCRQGTTHLLIESAGSLLRLAIADPTRVQMRNAPAELVCGKQAATHVRVEYAASKSSGVDGFVRGLEFQ